METIGKSSLQNSNSQNPHKNQNQKSSEPLAPNVDSLDL